MIVAIYVLTCLPASILFQKELSGTASLESIDAVDKLFNGNVAQAMIQINVF